MIAIHVKLPRLSFHLIDVNNFDSLVQQGDILFC